MSNDNMTIIHFEINTRSESTVKKITGSSIVISDVMIYKSNFVSDQGHIKLSDIHFSFLLTSLWKITAYTYQYKTKNLQLYIKRLCLNKKKKDVS